MKNTDFSYKTRDLYFSAFLFVKGFKLTSIDFDQSGNFFWFVFDEKEKCEKEEQKYLKNEVSVKAKEFADAIKFLKRKVSQ